MTYHVTNTHYARLCRNTKGQYHCDDGPAIVLIDREPKELMQYYFDDNEPDDHIVSLYGNSSVWVVDGKVHREDGPAVMQENGRVQFFLHGKEYLEREWEDIMLLYQISA